MAGTKVPTSEGSGIENSGRSRPAVFRSLAFFNILLPPSQKPSVKPLTEIIIIQTQ